MLIVFQQQQWLHQRASLLRYPYIGCLVNLHLSFTLKSVSFQVTSERFEQHVS